MALDPELKMLIEHVEEKIDTLAEGFAAHTEKLNSHTDKLDAITEKLDMTYEAVGHVQVDVVEVKEELGIIRTELKAKVDRDEFRLLEQRVGRIERRLATA